MMMENKKKKFNNDGITIIEIIVTLAIMMVVLGIAVASVSAITNTYARTATYGLADMFSSARTNAVSVAADKWYMEISYNNTSGDFTFTINKETQTAKPDGSISVETEVVEKEIYTGDLKITFNNKDDVDETKITLNSPANKLRIEFSPNQGEVKEILLGGLSLKSTVGCDLREIGEFTIERGSYKRVIELYYTTGKYEIVE